MKNQVENNKAKQNQAGMNKAEQPAENKPNRLVLPLGQTIFLPQTAMGVSYIDKVRTRVYLDSVQRQPEAVFLRGFYEIDLEYHGLEGNRLYKHRVMLPLRVELPADWLAPLDYEPEELHVVITKPMLCILSPYVLEFGSGLVVEYVGDRLYREEKTGEVQPKDMQPLEITAEDMPSREIQSAEIQERLESKFGSPAQPKSAEELLPKAMRSSAEAKEEQPAETVEAAVKDEAEPAERAVSAAKRDYHLPVWSGQKSVSASSAPAEKPPVKQAAASAGAEEVALPQVEQSKLRTMLTVAAISRLQAKGEILTGVNKNQPQEVILLEPKTEAVAGKGVASMPINVQVAAEHEETPAAAVLADDKVEMEVEQTVAEVTEPVLNEDIAEVMADIEEEDAVEVSAVVEAEVEPATVETVAVEDTVSSEPVAAESADEQDLAVTAEDYAEELAATVAAAAEQTEKTEQVADSTIKTVNADGVRLRVGLRDAQKIRPVPRPVDETNRTTQTAGNYCLKYYVVKPGDDPMSIALKHNVPLERLRETNKALSGDLTVGMVLRIPC